jgi:hypothetical protein
MDGKRSRLRKGRSIIGVWLADTACGLAKA